MQDGKVKILMSLIKPRDTRRKKKGQLLRFFTPAFVEKRKLMVVRSALRGFNVAAPDTISLAQQTTGLGGVFVENKTS